jgi:V/A-type H+/Na+-transporting ATPase subunit D
VNLPAGRSGRLRLVHQLKVARAGSDLLGRKHRILAGELDRLRLQARQARQEWDDAAPAAAQWLFRSQALDGAGRITAAVATTVPARLRITWRSAMGVRYPVDATVVLPPEQATNGSSALVLAARAHRRALETAARYAAADRALRLVTTELEATRLRQHAIDRRWVPRLVDRLGALQTQLDEQELEDSVRRRWTAGFVGARPERGAP